MSLGARVIKILGVVGASVALSGCPMFFGYMYTYKLLINNKLTTSIAHCYSDQITDCPYIIQGGGNDRLLYMSGEKKPNDEEKYKAFDRVNIKICDKLINLEHIRAIFPIKKHDDDYFEISIDEAVSNEFCQKN
jgi:hypothetical protein